MVELSAAERSTDSCCAPEEQTTCCGLSEKGDCCAPESSTCGCPAGYPKLRCESISSSEPSHRRSALAVSSA
jgi:hypothetical protein